MLLLIRLHRLRQILQLADGTLRRLDVPPGMGHGIPIVLLFPRALEFQDWNAITLKYAFPLSYFTDYFRFKLC